MIFDYLPFILMPFILATGVALNLLAGGARNELEENAPEYANLLYRSLAEQLLRRAYPVRVLVLFFTPVPPAVKGSVAALRVVFASHLAMLIPFVTLFLFNWLRS